MSVSFTIHALPDRALSPNGGKRSRRDPWSLSERKLELGDAAYHAVLATYGSDVPAVPCPVVVSLVFHVKHYAKPKPGDCPRCLQRALGGSGNGACTCYRLTDPSNAGGDVTKPIIDYGVVRHGIIPDDSYKYVERVELTVRHVESLEEERIEVTVQTSE